MNFTILTDDKTPIERTLKIRVESESIEPVWHQEVSRIAREMDFPGFRQGKAPPQVVEKHIGRNKIWLRVRELVANQTLREMLRESKPEPLTPPNVDFDDQEEIIETWHPGDHLEFTVTYILPPPSPEDIERDLMRRAGAELPEDLPDTSQVPGPPSSLPPDPRAQIPGSGVHVDRPDPSPGLPSMDPEPTPGPDPFSDIDD